MADLPTGTVTFLFTDMEASTRLLGQLGDRFQDVLEAHQRLLREAFAAAGGVEVGTEGDSFFVAFTAAPPAVAAAVAGQQALEAHAWPADGKVRVRMGMHTGEGRLGGDDYVGVDVHRAARIAAAGHGGQVLMSSATRALVDHSLPEGVSLRDLGEYRLKDLAHSEYVFQLVIPGVPSDFPPIKSLDVRRGNLPRQLTSFIGREKEVQEVKDLIGNARLVTLLGPGGAGKTRLSLQVGAEIEHDFEDGIFFVPLAPISDPDMLAPSIAEVLGVLEERDQSPIEALVSHLRSKDALLVLDNFEQVTAGASVVGELLGATERLKILTTSREPLALLGEHEYAVPPLGLPDPAHLPPLEALSHYEAVKLFVERASAVKPGFTVTNENAPAVAEICARLDGLPLAIELAAARVKLLAPDALLKRLEHRLALLAGGARNLPQRQQTLRDTIGWSYDLLEEHERALFARLAVFLGGFTLEAADAICNPGQELGVDTLDAIASLVNKSLLRQMVIGDAEDRFLMLQTVREFAEEQFEERDDREEMRGRHAAFFLELARRARPELMGAEQARWLDQLTEEHDNLRAALSWAVRIGDAATAGFLGGALWRFWQMRGHLREGSERLEEVLACPGIEEHPEARADALEGAGGVAYWMGEFQDAIRFYGECLELRRELGEPSGIAEAAYNLACLFVFFPELRDQEIAEPLIDEALQLFRGLGDEIGIAKVLWARGGGNFTGATLGSEVKPDTLEASKRDFEEALSLYREAGDRFGEGWSLHMIGVADALLGQSRRACPIIDEALSIFMEAGDASAVPLLLTDYAIVATLEGEGDTALRLSGAAEGLGGESGVGLSTWAAELEDLHDRMWALLPKEEAERAFAEGKEMTTEEAVELARRWSTELQSTG